MQQRSDRYIDRLDHGQTDEAAGVESLPAMCVARRSEEEERQEMQQKVEVLLVGQIDDDRSFDKKLQTAFERRTMSL